MYQRRVVFLALVFALCFMSVSHAADSSPLRKVRMAFTSLSGSMITPWMARSAGIFNKYGLDVEVISTPSGVERMNALIADEVQFLQIAGGTTASAALGGADVMIVSTTIDTFVQNLMVRPEIEKPEQLKGKSAVSNRLLPRCRVIASKLAFSRILRSVGLRNSDTARCWTSPPSAFPTRPQA